MTRYEMSWENTDENSQTLMDNTVDNIHLLNVPEGT